MYRLDISRDMDEIWVVGYLDLFSITIYYFINWNLYVFYYWKTIFKTVF